ncbi:uncharacterized protein V2V93DRAFT_380992 [Kockiozyma suomiensis]|uniref:uncharacterized protein n=1 Tax=Kockiozyma suomiensis TaxID=1337062 RepID=UPI0033431E0C
MPFWTRDANRQDYELLDATPIVIPPGTILVPIQKVSLGGDHYGSSVKDLHRISGNDGTTIEYHGVPVDVQHEEDTRLPRRVQVYKYPLGRGSKQLAFIGLATSFLVGVAFIILGILSPGTKKILKWTNLQKDFTALALNGVVLIASESLGYVHSLCLRWDMLYHDKLEFSSNLRLVQHTKMSRPNGIICNVIYFAALAMSYASAASIIASAYLYKEHGDNGIQQVFSKAGPITLGISFLVQWVICILCLIVTRIPTWDTSPLVTTMVAMELNIVEHEEGKCMLSVHYPNSNSAVSEPGAVKPKPAQMSAYKSRRQVKYVLWTIYLTLGVLVIAFSVATWNAYATESGYLWSFFPVPGNLGDDEPSSVSPSIVISIYFPAEYEYMSEWSLLVNICFTMGVQCVITIGLHCAELLVSLYRDEKVMRDALTAAGTNPNYKPFFAAFDNWPCFLLLVFKPVMHWMYGMTMYIDYSFGIIVMVPQFLYLIVLWIMFTVFVTYIGFHKPKGMLPASYGHLQTLANIVDEWHPKMFWGHKSNSIDSDGRAIGHAGTSSHRLPEVYPTMYYK